MPFTCTLGPEHIVQISEKWRISSFQREKLIANFRLYKNVKKSKRHLKNLL